MAKVIITIEDVEGGAVDLRLEFDPPLNLKGESECPDTVATRLAARVLEVIKGS